MMLTTTIVRARVNSCCDARVWICACSTCSPLRSCFPSSTSTTMRLWSESALLWIFSRSSSLQVRVLPLLPQACLPDFRLGVNVAQQTPCWRLQLRTSPRQAPSCDLSSTTARCYAVPQQTACCCVTSQGSHPLSPALNRVIWYVPRSPLSCRRRVACDANRNLHRFSAGVCHRHRAAVD
jgi:hypothetical protein